MFTPMEWESQTPSHQAIRNIAFSTVLFAMIKTHDAIAGSPWTSPAESQQMVLIISAATSSSLIWTIF